MPRDRTFGRHAKHSNGRKPAPMICGVSNCQLGCWTKTYGGEMVTSEYCEKPQEKPADSSRSPEERPPAPIVAAAATTGMSDRPCACTRNATPDESKPAPIARLVEPQMEPKVEDANPVAEEVQGGGRGEKETLPTFFSGVAVGLCILMQMLYVILQLLLEMARGTAKWTM
ncbi:hypothetical protein Trco_006036 [Trichoderma cornu-damae]|uniref:Uncharacterized protein n=1 Tax=Trichoderma cornu-damae TaxID=654480 RepID=A0A9P8QQH1_9HYPO|nr:hypothetical protein Trco_006036 [Trichoderma cornu-damae]